ncbi:MAG: hypothetical protein ACI8P2_004082, partial [Candidatus Latescibacterota bacterium]
SLHTPKFLTGRRPEFLFIPLNSTDTLYLLDNVQQKG